MELRFLGATGTVPAYYAWRDVEHGDECSCILLAQAVGVPADTVDFNYCRQVLQKHWRLRCNHGGGPAAACLTPQLPSLDLHDPVHAVLLANFPTE
jgi:hypothetical protein